MPTRDPLWYTYAPAISTPISTPITSPQTTNVFSQWIYLDSIRARFPPGVMGTCGFYVQSGGNQIIPFPPSQPWITGDDEIITFQLGGEFQGPLQILTANYGNFAHTLLFEFTYYPISAYQATSQPNVQVLKLIDSDLLAGYAPAGADVNLYEVTGP